MDDILKASGIVLLTVVFGIILKAMEVKQAEIYTLSGGILLLFMCIPEIKEIVYTVKEAISSVDSVGYVTTVLKAIAIVIISETVSGIAAEASHPYLAKCLNGFARVEIAVVSMPVFKALLETAISYI